MPSPAEALSRATRAALTGGREAARRWARLSLRRVDAAGLDWPYLDGGPRDAPVVMLLHGFGCDKDFWTLYARHLSLGYRVIAPDLPGFGDNDRTRGRDYGIAAQTERVRLLLDALDVDTCHLAGNSMGGYIALQFAAEHPDRLRTVTPIDNGGVASLRPSELELAVADGLNPMAVDSVEDLRRVLAMATPRLPRLPAPLLQMLLAEFQTNRDFLNEIFWSLAEKGLAGDLDDRLSEITVPTLIIWGRQDRIIDVSCVEVMTRAIPGAEAVVLENTGHIPMIERPAVTARHHQAFLARHPIPG